MSDQDDSIGGCACGEVRFRITGAPLRTGLCHCLTCRKAHGAAFNPFVVYRREQVELRGTISWWQDSASYRRGFCPACGSRVVAEVHGSDEVELSLGSFDAPGLAIPEYESWTIRREPWLDALPVTQFERNRS